MYHNFVPTLIGISIKMNCHRRNQSEGDVGDAAAGISIMATQLPHLAIAYIANSN